MQRPRFALGVVFQSSGESGRSQRYVKGYTRSGVSLMPLPAYGVPLLETTGKIRYPEQIMCPMILFFFNKMMSPKANSDLGGEHDALKL